jgi:hypothetical protein
MNNLEKTNSEAEPTIRDYHTPALVKSYILMIIAAAMVWGGGCSMTSIFSRNGNGRETVEQTRKRQIREAQRNLRGNLAAAGVDFNPATTRCVDNESSAESRAESVAIERALNAEGFELVARFGGENQGKILGKKGDEFGVFHYTVPALGRGVDDEKQAFCFQALGPVQLKAEETSAQDFWKAFHKKR